jgi:hypothetical protein
MFSDPVIVTDGIASDSMLFGDWRFRKDVGGDDTILIRILHRNFSAGAEGTRQRSGSQNVRKWCLPRDSQAACSVVCIV